MRSVALHTYLKQAGVLNGTPDEISTAKQAYRREYKRKWKQQLRPVKEIRYTITLKQYQAIKSKANHLEVKPTTYAKQIALESIGEPVKSAPLLEVLQLIGMAVMAFEHNTPLYRIQELVSQAEIKLLRYLQV